MTPKRTKSINYTSCYLQMKTRLCIVLKGYYSTNCDIFRYIVLSRMWVLGREYAD